MGEYRDSKGITHFSGLGRDLANNLYLWEERSSRERIESLLSAQTNFLYAQQIHNQKMEMFAIVQREEQWLLNSDAKGRFEFIHSKYYTKIINHLVDYVFNKLNLRKYVASDRLVEIHYALNDLIEPMSVYSNLKGEYSKITTELTTESSNNLKIEIMMLLLSLLIPPLFIILFYIRFFSGSEKKSRLRTERLEKTGAFLEKRIKKNENALIDKLSPAQLAYQAWYSQAKSILELTINKMNKLGLISKKQIALINELEKEYPFSLRIDWSAIPSDFLYKSANALLNDIKKIAEFKLLNPNIIFAELSLDSKDDSYILLTENPEILAKILTIE